MGRAGNNTEMQRVYREAFEPLLTQLDDRKPVKCCELYSVSTRDTPTTFDPVFSSVEAINLFTCRTMFNDMLQTWVHAAPNLLMIHPTLNLTNGINLISSGGDMGQFCAQSAQANEALRED